MVIPCFYFIMLYLLGYLGCGKDGACRNSPSSRPSEKREYVGERDPGVLGQNGAWNQRVAPVRLE
jgi:hypothetical protein